MCVCARIWLILNSPLKQYMLDQAHNYNYTIQHSFSIAALTASSASNIGLSNHSNNK